LIHVLIQVKAGRPHLLDTSPQAQAGPLVRNRWPLASIILQRAKKRPHALQSM
jgi:hypothetical protein